MDKLLFANTLIKIWEDYNNLDNSIKNEIRDNNQEYNNILNKLFEIHENTDKHTIKEMDDLNKKLKEIEAKNYELRGKMDNCIKDRFNEINCLIDKYKN